jgi:hypothetical protein
VQHFKAIIGGDIFEFESYVASHAVGFLYAILGCTNRRPHQPHRRGDRACPNVWEIGAPSPWRSLRRCACEWTDHRTGGRIRMVEGTSAIAKAPVRPNTHGSLFRLVAWELEHRHYLPLLPSIAVEYGSHHNGASSKGMWSKLYRGHHSKSPSLLRGVSGTHSAILRF